MPAPGTPPAAVRTATAARLRAVWSLALCAGVGLVACARLHPSAQTPAANPAAPPAAHHNAETPPVPLDPAPLAAAAPLHVRVTRSRRAIPRDEGPTPRASARIPGGAECLARLAELGIPHRRDDDLPGVSTPLVLSGPLAGIRFEPPLRCDCRLLLALFELAPELRRLGVSRVRHWGGHIVKLTPTGRLSLHASGLAIDIYELIGSAGAQRVSLDFTRGIGCQTPDDRVRAPQLNRLVCSIQRQGLFDEVISPDDDLAHNNHLHLAIARSADEPEPEPRGTPRRAGETGD